MNDPFEILGVSRDASAEDIRRAFLKQSKEHHPDTGGDPEKFREIAEARDILTDPVRRKNLEMYGTMADIEGTSLKVLEQLFSEIIDTGGAETCDIKAAAMEVADHQQRRFFENEIELKAQIAKQERLKNRVFVRSGQDNLFIKALKAKLDKTKAERQIAWESYLVWSRVIDMLADYEHKFEVFTPLMGGKPRGKQRRGVVMDDADFFSHARR